MKKEFLISKGYYYTISFIEGGAVMVIELLGAKIIAPYYGASLYVWSSVLGVTLGGLALGYFLGGYFSGKNKTQIILFAIILTGAFFAALSPLIAPKIMYLTDSLGVRFGSLVSVLLFLSPSLICMGMVSPLIIQLINKENEGAGKAAGSVYAISTVGGITATFLFGFYLIPELGIKASAYIIGFILGAVALIYFVGIGHFKALAVFASLIVVIKLFSVHPKETANARILYNSNGLFGQLTVRDVAIPKEGAEGVIIYRGLYLNGIKQTHTEVGYQPFSHWDYVHKIITISSIKPAGNKALLLGMGGGSINHALARLKFDVDVVELDERIPRIAKKYFGFNPEKSNLIIDDARHYIRRTQNKYDLVVFDLLKGECQPSYIFTMEGFSDLRKILNKDALVIINFQGNLENPQFSMGAKSIYKTLIESGFKVNYNQTRGEEASGDLIFIASEKTYDFRKLLENPRYYEMVPFKFPYESLITENNVDLSGIEPLTDDKPILEHLNKPAILEWRKIMMAEQRQLVEAGLNLF